MKILCFNGPNLNLLGQRDTSIYGNISLKEIEDLLRKRASELKVDVAFFQSNSEGSLIDTLQNEAPSADAIIINPGALTHYGLSLSDALRDARVPIIEVHLSNIYGREEWRAKSVISPVALGQISGLVWQGYLYAFEHLTEHLRKET